MNFSLLHKNLGSRRVWITSILAIAGIGFIAVLWKPLSERYFPVTVPIESILWTATPDYKIFFGPGTPPSVDLAKRLRMLNNEYGFSEGANNFPNCPLFISPTMFTPGGAPNDIVIFSPFTPESAKYLRSEYLHGQKISNP